MEGGPGSPPGTGALLLPPPGVPCPRFQLLAHAALSLAQVHDGFRTHDLVVAADGVPVPQDTRVRPAESGGRGQPPGVAVTNRLGGEEVTHALVAESAAEARRWLEAFGQHLYDLAQWKQCCEELMRIEEPPPRRPPAPLPPQGSLYHQTAPPGPPGPPPGEGLLLQENVSAEIRALLSSYYSDR
ncbi:hypothetical protein DUI87_09696 [Hirundo rustica rustica]|uniref:PH domain-containing protein n=1 Tax=Hirundo rustica rustica TaxID=333673 RepID=A0A3M0KMW6_HIRRU|nr:hypothetical protein DUI87_09696 [Hirundo rustica rustica]